MSRKQTLVAYNYMKLNCLHKIYRNRNITDFVYCPPYSGYYLLPNVFFQFGRKYTIYKHELLSCIKVK